MLHAFNRWWTQLVNRKNLNWTRPLTDYNPHNIPKEFKQKSHIRFGRIRYESGGLYVPNQEYLKICLDMLNYYTWNSERQSSERQALILGGTDTKSYQAHQKRFENGPSRISQDYFEQVLRAFKAHNGFASSNHCEQDGITMKYVIYSIGDGGYLLRCNNSSHQFISEGIEGWIAQQLGLPQTVQRLHFEFEYSLIDGYWFNVDLYDLFKTMPGFDTVNEKDLEQCVYNLLHATMNPPQGTDWGTIPIQCLDFPLELSANFNLAECTCDPEDGIQTNSMNARREHMPVYMKARSLRGANVGGNRIRETFNIQFSLRMLNPDGKLNQVGYTNEHLEYFDKVHAWVKRCIPS